MGLSLITVKNGKRTGKESVGNYIYVHHLRAVLAMLFVNRIWQLEEVDGDAAQELLYWVQGLEPFGIDVDENEITEEDLGKALLSKALFDIDYDRLPDSPFGVPGIFGTTAANAAVGLWKFVNHSDCDGGLSVGDVADVACMLGFIRPFVTPPRAEDAKTIVRLSALFRSAAKRKEAIAFA